MATKFAREDEKIHPYLLLHGELLCTNALMVCGRICFLNVTEQCFSLFTLSLSLFLWEILS